MRSTEKSFRVLRETQVPKYKKLQSWLEQCNKDRDFWDSAFYHVLFPKDVPMSQSCYM